MSGAIKQGQCSSSVNQGILKIQGNLTEPILNEIKQNSSPFTISFGAKTIKPFINQNVIFDSRSENTLTYKVNKYILQDIQYCKNIKHTGYWLQSEGAQQTPIAELYLTFIAQDLNGLNGNYSASVILVLPIYLSTSNKGSHDGYLNQIALSSAPVASLQTLFYNSESDKTQKSISYDVCFNFQQNNYINLTFFVFPIGISLTQNVINKFNDIPTRDFKFIGMYDINTITSPTIATSDNFKNIFTYYSEPPQLPGRFNADSCEYYKTTQYKCVPFNKLQDLSGDYVVAKGNSLNTILNSQEAVKTNIPSASGGIDTKAMQIVGFTSLGFVIVGVVLGVTKLVMNWQKEEPAENITVTSSSSSGAK
jgi:hypothetical protein